VSRQTHLPQPIWPPRIDGEPEGLPRRLALLVAAAFFMENLDGTIISTAAPRMAHSLGVQPVDLNIAITAFLLTLAVLVPGSGWLADRFGSRRVFVAAIAVFTLASAGCAASMNLEQLTVMRVLQGAGGAMMVPVGRLVVLRATAKHDLIRAISYLTWPGLVAPVMAPAIGGAIVTYASWRWIFLLNVPLGLVALLFARRIVPDVRAPARVPLDWVGFLLCAGGIAALVVAMERIGVGHVVWGPVLLGLAGSVVLLGLSVRHLLRTPTPLLNLRICRLPTFRVMASGGSVGRLVVSAVPFLATLTFQVGFGWSPLRSGLLVISLFVGNLLIKPATTPLLHRFGFRPMLLVSTVGVIVSLLLCALLRPGTQTALIAAVLVIHGIFRSTSFAAYNSIAYAEVGDREMNDANTLATTLQQLATGLGVAITALVLRAAADLLAVGGATADTAADRWLGLRSVASGGTLDYSLAFVLLALIMVPCLVEALRLPRTAGHQITGTRAPRPVPSRRSDVDSQDE
jgi:EmrB/QacA subfamily drug resistance transporter